MRKWGTTFRKFVPTYEEKVPTITLEGLLDTMAIDAYEGRKVATFDITGAYLQTDIPKDKFMLILLEGKFVDIMCEINTEYKQHVSTTDGRNTLYLRILKAIYGMIEYALLWYELYGILLKVIGFQINTYDMCVAKKDINRKK